MSSNNISPCPATYNPTTVTDKHGATKVLCVSRVVDVPPFVDLPKDGTALRDDLPNVGSQMTPIQW